MTRVFFLKELVNNQVHYSTTEEDKGKPIPFVHGADDMGHLSLDTKTDEARIKEIRKLIEQRRGGIFEVDADRYEAEKKREPSTKIGSGSKGMPRLAEQRFDPFRKQVADPNQAQRASLAGVLANAGAVAGSHVAPVTAPAAAPKAPEATTFSPRRGRSAAKA